MLAALLAPTGAGSATEASALPIGRPPDYRFEVGSLGGYGFRSDRPTYRVFLDMEGRVAAPQFGLLDFAVEGAAGKRESKTWGAFGASVKLPIMRGGFEYDLNERTPFFKLSLQGAPRRGGILGRGDRLRLDYTPARRTLELGMKMPLPWADYRATRPRNAHVSMPSGRLPARTEAQGSLWPGEELERIRHAMTWMDRMLTPNLTPRHPFSKKGRASLERTSATLAEHAQLEGHSFAEEESAYHEALAAAFTRTAGGDGLRGEALAATARASLLGEIIVPYNRLLGRIRRPGELTGLSEQALAAFGHAIDANGPSLTPAQRGAAIGLFREVVAQLDLVARAGRERWRTWRLVWLPLNYGLRPEDYDTQPELNHVLARVVGQPFSPANTVRYVMNERFYPELRRSILETRNYHVLWIHDYAGRNARKGPDRIAWSLALEGYVEAFVGAIRALDRGERLDLPQFVVLLDEYYYQGNGSGRVISFLERLGTAPPPDLRDKELAARVRDGVSRLRAAIAASPALTRLGERYVRDRVRVKIVITHPYDPTYVDDMVMRDHTKLCFRDVYDDDPSSGEAIFTGLGVGEHYVGPAWDDRSLVLRGTELVRIKDAARRLLLTQGVKPDEIPVFLRRIPYAGNHDGLCDSLERAGWTADVMAVSNGTGFREKQATVLKAALYNLMRPGAVLIAPDSLWTSDFWAGMFAGAALRGCHALPIAPAGGNAPSSALPTLGLMHQTLWSLARSAELLEGAIRRAGGTLRVGVYTGDRDVDDVRALLGRVLENGWRDAPLADRIAIHPAVLRVVREEYERMSGDAPAPVHLLPVANPRKPQLHFKAQFFADEAALGVLEREAWAPALRRYLEARRRHALGTATEADRLDYSMLIAAGSGTDPTGAQDAADAGDRSIAAGDAVCLATLGSHNQDRRSMLLDGEVLTAVSGEESLPTMIDFALLMGAVEWPKRADDLHAHFPDTGGLLRRLSRWLRDLI